MSLPLPVSPFHLKHTASWGSLKRGDAESAVPAANTRRSESAPMDHAETTAPIVASFHANNAPAATSSASAAGSVGSESSAPTYTPPEPPSDARNDIALSSSSLHVSSIAQSQITHREVRDASMHAAYPLTVVSERSIADPFAMQEGEPPASRLTPAFSPISCNFNDFYSRKSGVGSSSANVLAQRGLVQTPASHPLGSGGPDGIPGQVTTETRSGGGASGGGSSLGGSTGGTMQFYLPPPHLHGAVDAVETVHAPATAVLGVTNSPADTSNLIHSGHIEHSANPSSNSNTLSDLEDCLPKSESRHMWQCSGARQDADVSKEDDESASAGAALSVYPIHQVLASGGPPRSIGECWRKVAGIEGV